MSEPMSAEERARLREWAETSAHPWPTDRWECVEVGMTALLDDVDRLTEALEAAEDRGDNWEARCRECAADLADEKRRHAELLAGVWDECHESGTPWDNPYRAILSDTTTGDAHQ